jgi:hypothetical protein
MTTMTYPPLFARIRSRPLEQIMRRAGGEASVIPHVNTGLPLSSMPQLEPSNRRYGSASRPQAGSLIRETWFIGDFHLAGGLVLDRRIGAVMALIIFLVWRRPRGPASDPGNAKVGVPELITFWITGTGICPSPRPPGPFERNTPSGFIARISSADVVAGTTVTLQPTPASSRRMLRLMP